MDGNTSERGTRTVYLHFLWNFPRGWSQGIHIYGDYNKDYMKGIKAPQMVPIESIRPYDNNPRRHDEISEIVESIQRVGFRGSIWVDKDMEIIAGHGRYLSALQLGMKEVPVTIMDDLTEAEVKYLRIKDNKAFEGSEWDYEAYAKELDELKDLDFDTSDIEFGTDSEDEIHDEGYGEEFSLPSGDKPDECTISFTLSVSQEELVRDTLNSVDISEYPLGPSELGTRLYGVCVQWLENATQ